MEEFMRGIGAADCPKVLIADDEAAIRQYLQELVESLGYGCHTASDGEEALRLYKIIQPDLVVLDIYMPKMNGLAVMANVRAISPECPIILITGFLPYEQLVQFSSGVGPEGCVVKPINKAKMATLITKLLNERDSVLA